MLCIWKPELDWESSLPETSIAGARWSRLKMSQLSDIAAPYIVHILLWNA